MIDVEKKVVEEVEEFKMEIKLLSKKEDGTSKFLMTGTSAHILNMYRRLIVNKVPSMAIDTVEIIENSSALYDDMLAHRLGLIALKTDLDVCFIKDNKKYSVALALEAEGPCTIYAEQMETKDPGVYAVHKKTPIVKLLKNQRLKFIATATTGNGKEHIKHSPALLYYEKYPYLKVKDEKKAEAIIKSCPIDAAKLEKTKLKNINTYELCPGCLGSLEDDKHIETNDTDYLVTIEPWGQLTTGEIIEAVSTVSNNLLDELTKEIKKIK